MLYKYSAMMNKNTPSPVRKSDRQAAVLEIVRRERMTTQQDLVRALERRGLPATQASVSRDVAELGLVKVAGAYRAALPDAASPAPELPIRAWARRAIAAGSNLVVVHCDTGTASKVALALDQQRLPQVVGTLAGDDTVFVAVPSRTAGRRLVRLLQEWTARP